MGPISSLHIVLTFTGSLMAAATYYFIHSYQKFNKALDTWIAQGPEAEKPARQKAKKQIMHCYNMNSSTLNLNELALSSLPDCMNELSSVNSLFCNGNNLTDLPKTVADMSNITDLHLNNNPQLKHLPDCISDLKNLTTLSASNCQIENIDALSESTALTSLDLSNNKLTGELAELTHLKALKSLKIHQNTDIQALPETLTSFEHLSTLSIDPALRAKYPELVEQVAKRRKKTKLNILETLVNDTEHGNATEQFIQKHPVLENFITNLDRVNALKEEPEQTLKSIQQIIEKMQADPQYCETCLLFCDQATTSCADRVLLCFIHMRIEKDLQQPNNESSLNDIYQYAQKRAIAKYCYEEGRLKAAACDQPEEELEYTLAYLNNVQDILGSTMPEMAYLDYIKLDDASLQAQKKWLTENVESITCQTIIEDEDLRNLQAIKEQIDPIAQKSEFASDQLENESDADYLSRLSKVKNLLNKEQKNTLFAAIKQPEANIAPSQQATIAAIKQPEASIASSQHDTQAPILTEPITKHTKRTKHTKNPLSWIKGFFSQLRAKPTDEKKAGYSISRMLSNLWKKLSSCFTNQPNRKY